MLRHSLLLGLGFALGSACTPKSSSKPSPPPRPITDPTGEPKPDPKPDPDPDPTPQPCKDEGLEDAKGIADKTLRAAFCLDFAKRKACEATEDFLVACMTKAGDLDPVAYRQRLQTLNSTYHFGEP